MGMPAEVFAIDANLVTRDIGGEIIVVPVRGRGGDLEGAYVLSGSGAAIWRRIDGRAAAEDLAAALAEEYDVPRADAERDVREFLAQLAGAGLIRAEEP